MRQIQIMKRVRIELGEIAEYKNLVLAFYRAAKRKHNRACVQAFLRNFSKRLSRLGQSIREQQLPFGLYHSFIIRDPKKRVIHAACFEDRIFHHALINSAGPVLEKAMVAST